MDFLITNIFSLIIYSSIIFYGFMFEKMISFSSHQPFDKFINGTLFVIFFSIFINFFFPISIGLTNLLLLISSTLGLYLIIKNKIYYIETLVVILFSSLIIYKSYSYNDYALYHLPYMEILNKFKIIFGLSNIQFRFGHSSIFQNISSFFNNSFMGNDSYVFFTPLLIVTILMKLFKILKGENNIPIVSLAFIVIFYYLIHGNRYGALGNDYPSHGLAILVFLIFLKTLHSNKSKNINLYFYQILSLSLISFLSKLSFLLIFIFPFLILLKFYKKITLIKKYLFFFCISICFFFIKNFINTSCLIFPIYTTCIETDWLPNKYSRYSSVYVSTVSEAAVKDYPNMFYEDIIFNNYIISKQNKNKKKYESLNLEEQDLFNMIARYQYYNKLKNWIKPYTDNHFKNKIIKKLLPFTLFIIFLNLIFIFYSKPDKSTFFNFFKKEKYFILLSILNFLFLIVWFLNFPLVRYGLSYILVMLSFFSLLSLSYYKIDLHKYKKYLTNILLIVLLFSIFNNFVRIYNFKQTDSYSSNIVPIDSIPFKKHQHNKNFNLNLTNSVCGLIEPFCINSGEVKTFDKEFYMDEIKQYIFIKNNRNL